MRRMWRQVDELLRRREKALGETTWKEERAADLVWAIVLLAATYGMFMGLYAVFSREVHEYRQVLADMGKMPTLFLATLLICFPSLYVFSALLGSRLTFRETLRVLLAIVAITVTVLASFGPIVGFFALSTDNHPFMVLLNVAFCAIAGVLGVYVLWKALRVLLGADEPRPESWPATVPPPIPDGSSRQVKALFRVWILIYAVVGAQMAWVLRPFISDPTAEFVWFCGKQGNFFLGVLKAFGDLDRKSTRLNSSHRT